MSFFFSILKIHSNFKKNFSILHYILRSSLICNQAYFNRKKKNDRTDFGFCEAQKKKKKKYFYSNES